MTKKATNKNLKGPMLSLRQTTECLLGKEHSLNLKALPSLSFYLKPSVMQFTLSRG